jgi:hypothetical protein
MNLTDTQSLLLSAASQRDDLVIPISERLKGGAARSVAERLLALGLAEECTVLRSAPFWREEDGEPVGLRITRAGLAAIGLDDEGIEQGGVEAESSSRPPQPSQHPCAAPLSASPSSALSVTTEAPSAPSLPRAGSRQALLIAMLSRVEGASIAEISAAFGWLPHTARAALTGLRHKGHELVREAGGGERGSVYRITTAPLIPPAATDAAQAVEA